MIHYIKYRLRVSEKISHYLLVYHRHSELSLF